MFNSTQHQSTIAPPSAPAKPITTDLIVYDRTRGRVAGLQRFWQYLVYQFTRGHEPRIWQRHEAGELFYHGYDPRSRRSIRCATETEMRAWLDQLPYC